ncbi:MAG TPA: tRNA pseudouridine(38-40) synthase TruA [Gammaproteobacteria bacterium]|nr:tRNA pseudouridine(38-40) synthase TruA [Gammaproteobacteria bacterium]
MVRYALAIEYDGSQFCGWQRQRHCRSVQEVVETALSAVAAAPVEVTCAGRTDTGVHAKAQIVHFDTDTVRPDKAWIFGANTLMKAPVSVHWVSAVAPDFHARYDAIERRYRYIILNRKARPALAAGRNAWVTQPLDAARMDQAGHYLLGEHDFSAFRAAGCQAKHARRCIHALSVYRRDDRVIVDIAANAFLHNMVRIIVGSLLRVGRGEAEPAWVGEVLQRRDRTQGGTTADAAGLFFLGALYPEERGIPNFC